MGVKIVVADDHALTLDGIVRTLESAQDMEVVGTTNRGSEVMSLVKEKRPDVALLDWHMPGMDGIQCLAAITRHFPDVKVVMLSAFDDNEHIDGALDAGASAYIIKSVHPTDLPSAVRQVVMGTVFCARRAGSAATSQPAQDAGDDHGLTQRERTILAALARGLANKAISKELWVTEQTVKFHLNNVYRKLGVENRAAAVRYAFENNLVEPEPVGAQS